MVNFSKEPVVSALHDIGISLERLRDVLGCSQHELSTAVGALQAVPSLQPVLAALVGSTAPRLWPQHYASDGHVRPGTRVLRRAQRPGAWRSSLRSHSEIVALLLACGCGHAVRLVPVSRPSRGRSLPPLIRQTRAA